MSPKWEEAMWAELDALPDTEQLTATASWITLMQQDLVVKLAQRRRETILKLLASPDWDATRLAETIGARRNTITRLAEEGRAYAREHRDVPAD